MFVVKPAKKGKAAELDGSDKCVDVQDLATLSGAELVELQGPGGFAYPDGGSAPVATHPDFRGGAPQGNLRGENVSGRGGIHPTASTTAPMRKP